jgi:hypothetical protein
VSNEFRDKLLTLGVISRRTGDRVREWRSDDGERHKATTDELNNTVTQHARGDRQDVLVRADTVRVAVPASSIRRDT